VQDHEEIEKSGEKGHPMILNDFEYPAVFFFWGVDRILP
jgi:hypothetical protein